MNKIVLVSLLICVIYCGYPKKLTFNSTGHLLIAQFTDLHYGDKDDLNAQTDRIQQTIIDSEKLDFIAYTGDMVSGDVAGGTSGFVRQRFEQCVSVPNQNKIPYAITLGNHDTEGDLSANEIVQIDLEKPYSLTQMGNSSLTGPTNYYIPIYDSTESDIKFLLWFFYSGNRDCFEKQTSWGCISPEVISWYYQESKKFPSIPGIAFYHIPAEEYMAAYNDFDSYGKFDESVSCSYFNTGLTSAMLEVGNIKAVFVGHDHDNDFWAQNGPIQLHYGRKTGADGYGPKNLSKGSKIIDINIDGNVQTWIRTENGSTETQSKNIFKGTAQTRCAKP